ncbi:unnamed protein product [Ranitomeya imitator]|uniref:Reverse transcriptase domain-containing protein n=1 Tax=Ranitomeya imitator TaxID=111125 RepID=A0ABN9M3H3_9NEOB|nr:unnamed protein product [Ranitomeya imitator]
MHTAFLHPPQKGIVVEGTGVARDVGVDAVLVDLDLAFVVGALGRHDGALHFFHQMMCRMNRKGTSPRVIGQRGMWNTEVLRTTHEDINSCVHKLAPNLKSARESPDILREKLDKEIKLTQFRSPFNARPFANLRISLLGIVPKKEQGKYRLIHHLSYPKGRSVNNGIPSDDTTVTYVSFDGAVDMFRRARHGAIMAKSDIESTFRLLPTSTPDCYHLLGAMVDGCYYYNTCLPIGCSISCYYFEMFSTFLEWVVRRITRLPSITHYLDDILFVGPANSAICAQALEHFKAFMAPSGFHCPLRKQSASVSDHFPRHRH